MRAARRARPRRRRRPRAPTATPNPAFLRPTKITVGGKKFPVVSPIHVGDQLRLLVRSRFPAEIEIPEFGLLGFASPDAPARFELLPDTPGTFGILFAASGKPAGQIEVVAPAGTGRTPRRRRRGSALSLELARDQIELDGGSRRGRPRPRSPARSARRPSVAEDRRHRPSAHRPRPRSGPRGEVRLGPPGCPSRPRPPRSPSRDRDERRSWAAAAASRRRSRCRHGGPGPPSSATR